MNSKLLVASLLIFVSGGLMAQDCPDILKFVKRKLNSQETVNLCEAYAGQTLLIVNTASKCGFTPQFDGLEALYSKYKEQGLVVLGFPSNDFKQEHDDEAKTAEVCELTYGVNFPMFETTSVRGSQADPLYKMLASQSGTTPKWNFYKYLVAKDGTVIDAYGSFAKPNDRAFIQDIERALAQ